MFTPQGGYVNILYGEAASQVPLPYYIPVLTEKVTFSHTYGRKALFHTDCRELRLRSHLVPGHSARVRFSLGTNVNIIFFSRTQAIIRARCPCPRSRSGTYQPKNVPLSGGASPYGPLQRVPLPPETQTLKDIHLLIQLKPIFLYFL